MKKILSLALVLAMSVGSAAVHAQGASQNAPTGPKPQEAAGGNPPSVAGDLKGASGAAGLSTGAKVAIGLGVAAAVGAAASGGGSSGPTGTR